jgi:hypothetical protein
MKTKPNLALRSHINLEGELITLFSLRASPGKAAGSNYHARAPNLRPFVSPPRLEQKLLRENLAKRFDLEFKPFAYFREAPLRPIDAQKKK